MSSAVESFFTLHGLLFDSRTLRAVAQLIFNYCDQPIRIRIDYGDVETGRSWSSEEAVEGYVCSSGSEQNYPLLLPTTRSNCGNPIATQNIVALWKTDGVRDYKHANYSPKYDWENAMVVRASNEHLSDSPWQVLAMEWEFRKAEGMAAANPANFATEGQAIRWLNKKKKFERL